MVEDGPPGSGSYSWRDAPTMYFDSYVRLIGNTQKTPTLKCNGTVMDKFGDNETPMYVGTLTADEVVYAGAVAGYTGNSSFYLKSSKALNWWTITPYFYYGSFATDAAFLVMSDSSLNYDGFGNVKYNNSFRPAVSLKPNIEITGGSGIKSDPYIIK